MHRTEDIAVADLLLDLNNARVKGDTPSTQQEAYLALARDHGPHLMALAKDIVERGGLDPTTLPAVVPTGDRLKRYTVLEGNRRVLALKMLETPTIVSAALSGTNQRKLASLSAKYLEQPIETVLCVLFDSMDEAIPWIILRHTGANLGAGLVRWDTDEINRFLAKHAHRKRTLAGQILDFVEEHKLLDDETGGKGITTTLQRIVNTPEVRHALGIESVKGELVSRYPVEELAKGLTRIVDDLRTGRINVNDVRSKRQRLDYIGGFTKAERPNPKKALDAALPLADLSPTPGTPPTPSPPRRRRRRAPQPRDTVIPKDTGVDPTPPRINHIFNELLNLNMSQYPNGCAVLLRVFVDLSVDHALEEAGLMPEQQRLNTPLAKRMKELANHMHSAGEITLQIRRAVYKAADAGAGPLSASARTFNQYVHNPHVHPSPADLRAAWDELQAFIEKIWP